MDEFDEEYTNFLAEEAEEKDGNTDGFLIDKENANEINKYNIWG